MHRYYFNKSMAFSFILDEFTLCDISTSGPIILSSTVSHKAHHTFITSNIYLQIVIICI